MTKNKLVVLFLSLVLLLTFTTMSFAKISNTDTKVKVNSQKNGYFSVKTIDGSSKEAIMKAKKEALNATLSKQEIIKNNLIRNSLNSDNAVFMPLLDEVPGGGDIYPVYVAHFDSLKDFEEFTKVDLSEDGAGNDWMWLDYINVMGYPAQYEYYNSAIAPEPGGDFGGTVAAKDEAIEIMVGVPTTSELGDPYRVSNLVLDMYLAEPDADDEFWIEIKESPKWHLADGEWQMTSNQYAAPGYGNWWREDLRTPFLDLTAASGAVTLTYDQIYGMESGNWDGGNLWARTAEDAEWTLLTPEGGYPDMVSAFEQQGITAEDPAGFAGEIHDYETVTVDLSAYVGGMVQVRWAFASDGGYSAQDGNTGETFGWFVDNIDVSDGTGSLFINDGSEAGDMEALRLGQGEAGPWEGIAGWSGYGSESITTALNITENVIGAPGDSLGIRFRAIYDDNDEGTSGDPNWGFEVYNASFEVYTRFATDIGVSFVDLDSTFSKNGFITVGETYDPQVVVSNFGLSDITIYNTFVKIVNNFGSTVYERYLYTYAPAQGDTLKMYPGQQEFNEGMDFYNFADWTPEYQGDYTLIAYTDIYGGDDVAEDDSLVIDFHVYGEAPAIAENFNTITDDELYANWGYEGVLGQDDSWYIGDSFGRGDNELWVLKYNDDLSFDEQIVTPVLDCSEMTDVALKLEHHISGSVADPFEAKIIISTDGGATFQDFKVFTEATPVAERRGTFIYDISALADGQAAVHVGFTYKTNAQLAAAGGYLYFTVDDLSVYSSTGVDMTDPGTPVNFVGVAGDMQVGLTWSGLETASYYSVLAADTNDVAVAEVVAEVSDSMATIDGLTNGETLYFWVTSTDFNDNESAVSESVELTPADVTAPTQITDLHAADVDGETAKLLTWTAPVETAPEEGTSYEIRYAYMPITPATWDDAMALDEVPEVAAAGTEQSLTVPVDRLQDYYFDVYFAIKTTDEVGNVSEMSNPAHADDILPGDVVDLTVVDVTEENVTLSWTAPGDDGVIAGGPVWGYQIRVAYDSLGDEFTDWESAQILTGLPTPSAPGETEYYTAVEFVYTDYGQTFGIVAIDWNGNVSEVIGMAYAPSWDNFNPNAVEEETIPTSFALNQNYPNPFNPTTSISYQLPNTTHVKLEVFGTNGQKIRTLVNGTVSAGNHNVQWDAMDARGMKVASGIYFYRLETGDFTSVKKMTLMK